jgi:hypothetical protein
LAHFIDAQAERFLLKVGHSTVDVFSRVSNQSRTTGLPEDPVVLRVYPCPDSAAAEARLRKLSAVRATSVRR